MTFLTETLQFITDVFLLSFSATQDVRQLLVPINYQFKVLQASVAVFIVSQNKLSLWTHVTVHYKTDKR